MHDAQDRRAHQPPDFPAGEQREGVLIRDTGSTSARGPGRLGVSLGFLVVYVAAMGLGRVFTLESTGLALFWPAAGVAALWLVRSGTRRQLVIDASLLCAVTTAFFLLLMDDGAVTSVLLGVTNVLQAVVARLVLSRLDDHGPTGVWRPAITDSGSLRDLVAAAVAAALLGAPVGALAWWVETGDLSWATGLNWFVRNACGILVPAAAALALAGASRDPRQGWRTALTAEPRPGALPELGAAVLVMLGAGAVVVVAPEQIPLTYLTMGVAAWVGSRFAPAVGGLYTLVFGTAAIVLTLAGLGPFGAIDDVALRANAIQLFVAMTTLLVLFLSCGVEHRADLAAQLREAEVRARSRADLLDAVNGAIVDGLCVSDSWGHVVMANPAAGELGGADESGVHVHDGSTVQWYWPDGSAIDPQELPHARALRGEVVALSDVIRRDIATGTEKVLAVSAVPLHHGAPHSTEVVESSPLAVVLMRDVSRQRAQQRAQENFVAVVAHDLNSPVAGVLSWAELALDQLGAEDTPDLEAACQSLARIQRAAGRMSTLITDLLDYTVADSAPLNIAVLDLDELVDSIIADLERPHEAAVVSRATLGVVAADALLTRQLFSNLIGNAIKYVGPGVAPRVRIESRRLEGSLEVRLSDNGVGIPEHDRIRIFDTFYRASATSSVAGAGLGLAICRRAVERHGGWIAAREGRGGLGTTFVFTLPLTPTDQGE